MSSGPPPIAQFYDATVRLNPNDKSKKKIKLVDKKNVGFHFQIRELKNVLGVVIRALLRRCGAPSRRGLVKPPLQRV